MIDAAAHTKLTAALAAEPGAVFETVARDHNATLRQTVEALPEAMRRFAQAASFVEIMGDLGRCHAHHPFRRRRDGVHRADPGRNGRTRLLQPRRPHRLPRPPEARALRRHRLRRAPFFGRPSASILFFNLDGGVMFKIFVGRDEKRELLANQLAAFRAMADRLCEPQRRSA